jgi:hypothetical protein
MKINAIITGSTGMVGKGVLYECLDHPDVDSVLILNRNPLGIDHPKLKEIIPDDFYDLSPYEKEMEKYNACFFCLGISSAGVSTEQYKKITYDLTLHLARTLFKLNPDLVFNYVSGTGTSTQENSRMKWANIKGKTENDILKLGFKKAFMFRPGFIQPQKGIKSRTKLYRILYIISTPLFPLLKLLFPNQVTTTTLVGKAMINSVLKDTSPVYLENRDINKLGRE